MSRWRPILAGDEAARARDIVGEIADRLLADDGEGLSPGVASGKAGVAIFLGYAAAASEDERCAERAERLLEEATDELDPTNGSLCNGFIGLAWALAHLPGRVLAESVDDPCAEIDEILGDLEGGSAELLFGLSGAGIYALERLPTPGIEARIEHLIAEIDALSIERPGGVTWATASNPAAVSLGAAHGSPGVLAFLGGCAAAGLGGERTRRLLDRGAAWVLSQRRGGEGAQFVAKIGPDIEPQRARAAWCYGEPGIAATLAVAGLGAGRADLVEAAVDLARIGGGRTDHGVVDASLCHGDAGNGHIYNRLYQQTGDLELAAIARRWLGQTIDRHRQDGLDGYLWYDPVNDRESFQRGFLYGISGIGLALLAAISDLEPAWDRWLGASSAMLDRGVEGIADD